MKKTKRSINIFVSLTVTASMLFSAATFANTDEKGAFGGITQGISLPKTTEQLIADSTTARRTDRYTLDYSEMVFLGGVAERFDGTLDITQNGVVSDTKDVGSYTVTYRVVPNAENAGSTVQINRNITFRVNYRKVQNSGSNQLILDYEPTSWTETITAAGGTYTLVPARSYLGRSIIKDITPGISYYKGETSQVAHYTGGGGNGTTVETSGTIYGYDSPWSKTETERLNVTVQNGAGWQLEAQVRPSVSVNKLIQYSPNEPTAISFDGNYYEVTKNQSALSYNIFTMPLQFQRGAQMSGSISIPNTNKFEMLPAPDLAFLKGHFAEDDIKKMFAMQIFEGEPKQFQPAQAMTRAQFVTGLVKAFKIPLEVPKKTSSKKPVVTILFSDVNSNRPDFDYLLAATKSGIVYGRYNASNDNGFRPDAAITMEEAITIIVRGLGLENLGLTPTTVTPFKDDAKISSWAKKEISAAYRIGIIDMDANGNLNPQKTLTKAECAALINSTIDYMRSGLPTDYVDHILNYAN